MKAATPEHKVDCAYTSIVIKDGDYVKAYEYAEKYLGKKKIGEVHWDLAKIKYQEIVVHE